MRKDEEFKDVTVVDEYPPTDGFGEDTADFSESEVFRTPTRNNKGKVRLVVACVFFSIALVINVVAAIFTGGVVNGFIFDKADNIGEAFGLIFLLIFAVAFDAAALIASVLSIVFSVLALKHSKITALVFLIIVSALFALNIVLFIIMMSSGHSSNSETTAMIVGFANTFVS